MIMLIYAKLIFMYIIKQNVVFYYFININPITVYASLSTVANYMLNIY